MIAEIDDAIIWLGSVAAGLGVIWAALQLVTRSLQTETQRALIGKWFGYALFDSKESGLLFFTERIHVWRSPLFPWRMKFRSMPDGSEESTTYSGYISVSHSYIYMTSREPVYHDRTFYIGRFVMGREHSASKIVGLALGATYDSTVHCANAYLMTKRRLDPDANANRPPRENVERKAFVEAVRHYVRADSENLQLFLV